METLAKASGEAIRTSGIADTAAISTEAALAVFDSLATIGVEDMLGAWTGSGFPTHHPLDGVLEAYHWHGKRFDSSEQVHPLVFENRRGDTVCVNPLGLLATQRSGARLRLPEYRGKISATMIYDHLPIHDVFRRVDERTVIGLMDLKGMDQPFFFLLRRE